MKRIETFDIILIGPAVNVTYSEFTATRDRIRESDSSLSVGIPHEIFPPEETVGWKTKDYQRCLAAHIAHCRCVVTLLGWDTHHECIDLVSIARHLQITVLPVERVKAHLTEQTNWLPADDRN